MALITQAAFDLMEPTRWHKISLENREYLPQNIDAIRSDAVAFFNDDIYVVLCDWLDLNPSVLRGRLAPYMR